MPLKPYLENTDNCEELEKNLNDNCCEIVLHFPNSFRLSQWGIKFICDKQETELRDERNGIGQFQWSLSFIGEFDLTSSFS